MALVKTFDKYDLQKEFAKMERDYFSLSGYDALINLFDETGVNTELDVIAICCEFTESTPEDIRENYSNLDNIADADDISDLLDALNYYTIAILLDNGNVLYADF